VHLRPRSREPEGGKKLAIQQGRQKYNSRSLLRTVENVRESGESANTKENRLGIEQEGWHFGEKQKNLKVKL